MKRPSTLNHFISTQNSFKSLSLLLVFFLFFIITKVHSQIPDSILSPTDTNFFQITSKVDAYLNSLSSSGSGSMGSGSGGSSVVDDEEDDWIANYGRWRKYWESRVDRLGNFKQYYQSKSTARNSQSCDFFDFSIWKSLGPDRDDENKQNIGRISALSVNPLNHDDIVAAGENSSFWRTTDGGQHWHNTADDDNLSYIGVGDNKIFRQTDYPNRIYAAATSNNVGPVVVNRETQVSSGIVSSIDNGETWQILPLFTELNESRTSNLEEIRYFSFSDISDLGLNLSSPVGAQAVKMIYTNKFGVFSYGYNILDHGKCYRRQLFDTWSIPRKEGGNVYVRDDRFTNLFICPIVSEQNKVYFTVDDEFAPGRFRTKLISFDYNGNIASNLTDIDLNIPSVSDDDIIDIALDFNYQGDIYLLVHLRNNDFASFRKRVTETTFTFLSIVDWTTSMGNLAEGANLKTFVISPFNDNVWYVECGQFTDFTQSPASVNLNRIIMKSVDYGVTFEPIHQAEYVNVTNDFLIHPDLRAVTLYDYNKTVGSDPNGNQDMLLMGTDGGISRTIDGCITIENINGIGLDIGMYYGAGVTEQDAKHIMAGAQDGSYDNLINGRWQTDFGGDKGDFVINPVDDLQSLLSSNGGIAGNWSLGGAVTSTLAGQSITLPIEVDRVFDRFYYGDNFVKCNFFVVGLPEQVSTINNGDRITSIASASIIGAAQPTIYYSKSFIGGVFGGVYRAIRDASAVWTNVEVSGNLRGVPESNFPLGNAQINDIAVSNVNPNHLWVVFGNLYDGNKVFTSIDGGVNWINISGCLPNLPVFSIVYQNGSNNRIYIGTDIGVYYHDDDMDAPDKWVKYGNNQVEASVYDLDINYCGNYLLATTYGRGIRQAPLLPAKTLEVNVGSTLEFNDGAVHNIHSDIHIDGISQMVVTNNTTINMAAGKKIIVDAGGLLVVDHGTITNECNTMWEGIIVKGNNNVKQEISTSYRSFFPYHHSDNQGYVYLKNATISNAHEAIRLYNPDAPYVSTMITDQTGEAGGIVQAENSSFINNKRSCEFMYYHYFDPITGIEAPNISYFTNCTFTTDDNHRTEYPFANHITMWSVNGVNISSCLFKNDKTATTLTSAELMGQGIYTMDASYTVKYSGFENLTRGLQAIQGGNGSVNVFKTGFKDNLMGLYLIGGSRSSIRTNSFESGSMTISPPSYLIPVGASFLGNTGYGFSNNTFTGTSLDIGSWICNSGSDDNLCISNYYESNTYANLSNYKNRKSDGFLGLQYKCNINKTNIKDFTVYSPGGTSTLGYGIRDNQGSATEYVGNIFTLSTFSPDPLAHFDQRDAKVKYYIPTTTLDYSPDLSKCSPSTYFNTELSNPTALSTCPLKTPPSSSNITSSVISGMAYYNGNDFTKFTATERTNIENSFITNKSNYEYFSNQLKNLIDNGNTPELIENIQASSQAADLRATLLSSSPYLSAEALMAASDQTAVLSEAIIFEILCANPEALNDQALLEYLQTKNVPLPQWMIDVLQNNTNTTARTLMEYAISDAHDKMMVDARAILQDIQFNPEGLNHEEMRFWLGQLHNVEADYSIIDDYIELGNYNEAQIIMNSIPLLYKLDKYQGTEYQTMLDLNNWKLDLFQNGTKSYTTMSENEKSSLQAIADNGFGLGKYKAENILNYFANGTYLHLPELPNNQNQRKANPIKSIAESKEVYIKAYPNPAKDLLIFEFQLPCVEKEALLEIIDITGKKVYEVNVQNEMHQHILDVQKFANGLYSYTLKCGGSIISNGKVSIQK